jgi:hypothetical protein
MEKMRVLVANDPCLYREAITDALRELRPQIDVSTIEPGVLEGEVARLRPHLVVCSQINAAVHALLAWIVIYPNGENRAVINTAGEQETIKDVRLGDLLSTIDRIELLWSEVIS